MFNFFSNKVCENINNDKFEELANEGYKIIDVRTKQEFNEARIENAILIDIYSPDFREKISKLDKTDKYLVYCRSGNRSRNAVIIMKENGFQTAYNLSGGIISWYKSGKKIIN